MPDAKLCPNCSYVLRPERVESSVGAWHRVATDLLFWAMVALFLAFLWAPRHAGELYGVLGGIALAAWMFLRSRRRVVGEASAERERYLCGNCYRRYEGDELREITSVKKKTPGWPF